MPREEVKEVMEEVIEIETEVEEVVEEEAEVEEVIEEEAGVVTEIEIEIEIMREAVMVEVAKKEKTLKKAIKPDLKAAKGVGSIKKTKAEVQLRLIKRRNRFFQSLTMTFPGLWLP